MPHIHNGPGEIDQTVTAYIVLRSADQPPRLWLHKHRKLGVLLPAGGHVELTETHWQAIAHEILEETGYSLRELQVMQPALRVKAIGRSALHPQPLLMNTHTFGPDTNHYHADTDYLFVASEPPAGKPASGESTDVQWLNRQEVIALDDTTMFADTQNVALQIFDTFLDAWEPVPTSQFSLDYPTP